jgi:ParB-like chromosome segregation protein Spo0J
MSIFVDKEMRALIPPLSEEELDQLEENVVKEGIRDPLVTWPQPDGREMLIDGHNRFDISRRYNGIPFNVVRKDFPDREAAKAWIIRNQFGRRNLSLYDRSVLALKLKPLIAEKAKENQVASGGAVPQKSAKPIDTREELAKIAGVSHDTIHKVETIQNSGNENLIAQIKSGEMSINQGFNEIRERERRKVDFSAKAALDEAEARNDDFLSSKTVTLGAIEQNQKDVAVIARGRCRELYNAIKKILFMSVASIDFSVINPKTVAPSELQALEDELNTAIATLTKIKKIIGR